MLKTEILNSKGEPIVLTTQEQNLAQFLTHQIQNSLGYEIPITTLTAISKSVVEQRFFTIAPADYLPVRVGQGAWSAEIMTYRDYSISGDFETGILNTGANNSRLAEADSGVDSITVPIKNWGKSISWTIFDLRMAAQSGNWDLVSSKEKARKRDWDLGLQKIAFLGSNNSPNVLGLFTQTDVSANTTLITEYINGMSETEFSTFVQGVLEAYRANAQRTVMPTHFIIPEADFNGLVAPVSATYPVNSKLEYLEKAFKTATMNPNFRIMPNAYADQSNNADVTGLNKNRYTLLNYDEDSVRLDIPVDYTNTLANSINGFNFQNVGYGQFTGAKAYRPREMLYMDWAS